MTIPFKDIRGTSPLFRDYMAHAAPARSLFATDHHDPKSMQAHFQRQSVRPRDRDKLADRLSAHNEKMDNASELVRNHIQKLREPGTLAVVTGQQAGLFGGPLYTIYKAIGTVVWCSRLRAQFPEFDFVPVFWMEIEDHDLGEIRSIHVIGADNELRKISYHGDDPENLRKTPICGIPMTEDIRRVFADLRNVLPKTDFSESMFDDIEIAYRPGESLADGFGKLMARWLGSLGLVLMDPSDAELKRLAAPVFQKEIDHAEEINRLLLLQSAEVTRSGYALQVETDPSNCFVRDEGPDRLPFNARGLDKVRVTAEELGQHRGLLQRLAIEAPERFIPNVVLRPMVQDYLLPTAAYIAGPGEIAYLAQFRKIYEFFDIPAPAVIPRPFVTLLEKKIKKVTDKYNIQLMDVFNNGSGLVASVAQRTSASAGPRLDAWVEQIKAEMGALESVIVPTDASLKGAVATALDKTLQAVGVLKTKTLDAEKRSHELAHSQLSKAIDHTFPYGNFQERSLNILYYFNKYGAGLVGLILKGIENDNGDHQVIEL